MSTFVGDKLCWQIRIALAVMSGILLFHNTVLAQIVPDNTLGAESSVVTPNVDFKGLPSDRIDAGAIRGANLFHSFREFNVGEGRGAYFSNPAGVENIFSRVTGANPSNILGRLGVLGNANLFLLNPNGIVFGLNASLDIPGSFLGSTANSFNFPDGTKFSATNPAAQPLLSVSVPLGVQFNQQPSGIVNAGNLSTGQNLTLTGGTVVSTGQLSAPSGQVSVATVPSESVVNLSPSAQFLNIETPAVAANVGLSPSSASLTKLLTGSHEQIPGLTVNSNGQVELASSGLPVEDGDVVARKVTAQTATLTANHNLTLLESQLNTAGDLNLLARDTVRVRDSVASPFVAQAGGHLTIRGNQGIDILALNHPQTPFVSGGNLSLISDGIISGDAHFSSGGGLSFLNLTGQPGNFVSLYDPIISANGDVVFGNYTGAALKVESTGRIIGGNITINNPDIGLTPNPNDSDIELLRTSRALILRSGLTSLVNLANIPTAAGGTTFAAPSNPSSLPPGSIQVGSINTSNAGNGGPVILSATGNIVTTGNIRSVVEDNSTGRAGDIRLEAGGNITVRGNIEAFVAQGSSGQGGNINLVSRNGNIDTSQGFVSSVTTDGESGNIEMAAPFGNIFTANIFSFIGAGGIGKGGSITLRSGVDNSGNISVGLTSGVGIIDTTTVVNDPNNPNIPKGIFSTTGENGLAGDITLTAASDIRSGDIQASSRNDLPEDFSTIRINSLQGTVFINNAKLNTTNNGDFFAGDIFINGRNIEITNNSQIESKGVVGRIEITANNNGKVTIIDSTVDTQTINGVTTDLEPRQGEGIKITAGEIQINKSSLIAQTNSEAPPGSITLDAVGFVGITNSSKILNTTQENAGGQQVDDYTPTITLKGSSITVTNSEVDAATFGVGNAGDVIINARDNVTFDGTNTTAFSTVENTGRGRGGDIDITTGSLFVRNGAQLQALTEGQGDAGNVIINARDNVTFDGKSSNGELSSAAFTSVEEGAEGIGGNISITSGSLSVTNGARLFADTLGRGNAGKIEVNATSSVNISGSNSINGLPSALFTSTSARSTGVGGDINITTNLFRILDGAVLFASTSNNDKAGDITINTSRFEAVNGGQLIANTANTFSSGAAGTIKVNASQRVTIGGRDASFAARSSRLGNRAVENNVTDSDVFSGLFVNSRSLTRAGDIVVSSPIVFLDNKGRLIAESGSSDGGNITLQNGHLLLLRRESFISTTAGTENQLGNGGEINIDYPKGFIIAAPRTNSDIAANAFTGSGGSVTIKALGFVNIGGLSRSELERRLQPNSSPLNPQRLPSNDITAISQENPNLSGVLDINAPNIDPTRGTIQLPENLRDFSGLIALRCPVGVQGAGSRFAITGRGGLPPSPGSALSTDTFLGSAANASPGENATSSTSASPREAQGVEIGPRGEIILTARPSTPTSYTPWQRFTGCYGQ